MARSAKVIPMQRVLPEFDGHRIDRFKLSFSGSCELDPSDPDDHAIIEQIKLGGTVRVEVEAFVKGRPHDVTVDASRRYVKTVFAGGRLQVLSVVLGSVRQLAIAGPPQENPLDDADDAPAAPTDTVT